MKEPHIIRIELPTQFGMKSVNSYLVKGEELTLVDCGENSEDSWKALCWGLKEAGLLPSDIEKIIITHPHVDHIGMAARVAETADVPVWVSDKCKDWALQPGQFSSTRGKVILDTMEELLGAQMYKQAFPQFEQISSQLNASWLPLPEEEIRIYPHQGNLTLGGIEWEVHYVPGHTYTQSCFFHRESGKLLSADMLLKITPTPVVEAEPEGQKRRKNIIELLASYQQLKALEIQQVYPGHYEIFSDAPRVIEQQIARIHMRKDECFYLIQQGQQHFLSLYSTMYKVPSLPAFNMLIGYLDLLEFEGKIRWEEASPEPSKIIPVSN